MALADYQFYLQTYGGSSIEQSEWLGLSVQASAHLDALSNNRIASVTDEAIIAKIKLAECQVADVLKAIQSDGDGIVSESIGSSSVTYDTVSSHRQTKAVRVWEAAKLHMGSTGLLYRGYLDTEIYAN